MGSNTSTYPKISNKTVVNFDPTRYQGIWYGHGFLPIGANVYSWVSQEWEWNLEQEKMFITNTYHVSNGENKIIKGVGTILSSGKLSISLVSSNRTVEYLIHHTDYDDYSIVGDSSGYSLWILSRKRMINQKEKRYLSILAEKFGYDTYNLRWNNIPYKYDLLNSIVNNVEYMRIITTTRNLQIVEMSLNPGGEIKKEKHRGSQFFLVISGEARLEMLGDVLILKKGESSTVRSNVEHYLANSGEEMLKLLTVYSPPEH